MNGGAPQQGRQLLPLSPRGPAGDHDDIPFLSGAAGMGLPGGRRAEGTCALRGNTDFPGPERRSSLPRCRLPWPASDSARSIALQVTCGHSRPAVLQDRRDHRRGDRQDCTGAAAEVAVEARDGDEERPPGFPGMLQGRRGTLHEEKGVFEKEIIGPGGRGGDDETGYFPGRSDCLNFMCCDRVDIKAARPKAGPSSAVKAEPSSITQNFPSTATGISSAPAGQPSGTGRTTFRPMPGNIGGRHALRCGRLIARGSAGAGAGAGAPGQVPGDLAEGCERAEVLGPDHGGAAADVPAGRRGSPRA